ncbi:hypothetical protein PSPO01_16064 [Paraphaeosphaeria sporulosa]
MRCVRSPKWDSASNKQGELHEFSSTTALTDVEVVIETPTTVRPSAPRSTRLKSQGRDAKRHKGTTGGSRNAERNQSKRQHTSDDDDDHTGRPHNPNKPTFMATKATREDLNAACTRDIECNVAALDHTFAMMATRTLPLRDA